MNTTPTNKNSSGIDALKIWLWPGLVGILGFTVNSQLSEIKTDLRDIKEELKVVSSRSSKNAVEIENIKPRIERIESKVYSMVSAPTSNTDNTPIKALPGVAILYRKEEEKDKKYSFIL